MPQRSKVLIRSPTKLSRRHFVTRYTSSLSRLKQILTNRSTANCRSGFVSCPLQLYRSAPTLSDTTNYVTQLWRTLLRVLRVDKRQIQRTQPLRYGDVLRDFPYFTETSTIQYFSTHPSLCQDIFGYGHAQRIRLERGMWSGRTATVCGARAGRFWIVLDGDTVARELSIPVDVAMENWRDSVRDLLTRYHGITLVEEHRTCTAHCDDAESGVVRSTSNDASSCSEHETASLPFTDEVMMRVKLAIMRAYTTEECAFLQRAPDLYVTLMNEKSGSEYDWHHEELCFRRSNDACLTYDCLASGGSGTEACRDTFFLHRSSADSHDHHSCGRCSDESSTAVMNNATTATTTTSTCSSSCTLPSAATPVGDALPISQTRLSRSTIVAPDAAASTTSHHATCSYSDIVIMSITNELVILAPHVVAASKTVGWAGESPVVADAGGVHNFKASLSASFSI